MLFLLRLRLLWERFVVVLGVYPRDVDPEFVCPFNYCRAESERQHQQGAYASVNPIQNVYHNL